LDEVLTARHANQGGRTNRRERVEPVNLKEQKQ
jgi:hypothetical protein